MKSAAQMTRYYILSELRHTRARVRIGSISEPNARKERKGYQRDLVKLRTAREAPPHEAKKA